METITFDEKSIHDILNANFDISCFIDNLSLPATEGHIFTTQVCNQGYVLSKSFQAGDNILIISLQQNGPLSQTDDSSRREAISRIFKCFVRCFGRKKALPPIWKPYHFKNRISFQADKYIRLKDGGKTNSGRIVVEKCLNNSSHLIAYALIDESIKDLSAIEPDPAIFSIAQEHLGEALSAQYKDQQESTGSSNITLPEAGFSKETSYRTLDEWYLRLTKKQLEFVDSKLDKSIRIIGPAGSGKTLSLVIKMQKDIDVFTEKHNRSPKILFLTHAMSTATNIESLIYNMSNDAIKQFMYGENSNIEITTIYALAEEEMQYNLSSITPISLDGHEGKKFQAEILSDILEEFEKSDFDAYKSGCSEKFTTLLESNRNSTQKKMFIWELLNEFACVIDAEGVYTDSAKQEKYLKEKRKNWMMLLNTDAEKKVILRLHSLFGKWLRGANAIGCDQMIVDYLNYLSSFKWEAKRRSEGFDILYVDELHLFNRMERMIFTRLLKRSNDELPLVYMASDINQTPRDTFAGLTTDAGTKEFWSKLGLRKVDKIELNDVFRFTRQIFNVLQSLDLAFPGEDLLDDWLPPKNINPTTTKDGPIPTSFTFETAKQMRAVVFEKARRLQNQINLPQKIAVLSLSQENFLKHVDAYIQESFYIIDSREQYSSIKFAKKKFIYSMPEYVAGMQFDTVFLIDVNQDETPATSAYYASLNRKFVSQLYLGASRAETNLGIYACKEHGGISSALSIAIQNNLISMIDSIELI